MRRVDIGKWRILAVIVIVIVLLISGTILGVSAQSAGVLRVGIVTPATLDPALGSNDGEVLFNRSLYDHLIEILPDRSLAPNLATDWTISEDGLT